MAITNVIFTGVGGQGVLLASDVLAEIALRHGLDVKKSEVHGMSQRGGSVISQVRFGEKIYAPLVSLNQADFIVAFEKLEAVRYLDYLKPNGVMIANDYEIIPATVEFGDVEYPKEILPVFMKKTNRIILENITKLAEGLGNPKVLNVIMLGILSNYLEIPEPVWRGAIKTRVPDKFLELNLKAFQAGREIRETAPGIVPQP
ncbi:indolepyruvate oxidoreductase subunit beta [bacterium BMS3Abin05]|nr:indolepyruvate oxidoreductase subunit beta [bacterium BMS3Abin05]GBE27068.1 indolepyruvate oxidoreductase subunit beta [bacterium BMS3Bbin03]HDZ10829.1 indolepyruvate oxidoreductase subunit beta [Bacteroidota bacterium]